MLRTALGLASRCVMRFSLQPRVISATLPAPASVPIRHLCALQRPSTFSKYLQWSLPALFQSKANVAPCQIQQSRTVIKHSWSKGTRKSVKIVTKKYYRLHWGIWIRTHFGRHKRVYRKQYNRKREMANHVFLSATRSRMMDKMVCYYWRRRKFYVDDPYEPYHTREEFELTRRKPRAAHPPLSINEV